MSRRYAHSMPHIKTNFSFGDDVWDNLTIYDKDYRTGFTPGATSAQCGPALISGTLLNRRRNKNHENLSELWRKMPTTLPEDASLGNAAAVAAAKVSERAEKKKSVARTNFQFGNDVVNQVTTYQDMVDIVRGACRPPCSPPLPAEILPPAEASRRSRYRKSILQKDFPFYGPRINSEIFLGRLRDLDAIKGINQNDSLALASSLASKRPFLSRSRLDYRHPLERVRGNTKLLMMQAPSLVCDSIWSSVNGRGLSENKTNFTWPSASTRLAQQGAGARPYLVH